MVHRFSRIEIDEEKRELRADGRVRPLQPRVFDLLAYLATHRERVVSKDELLDAVWPGVIVTDASLQRAVSLARSAFGEIGLEDVIRNYPRQGYRFCMEASGDAAGVPAAHGEQVEDSEPGPVRGETDAPPVHPPKQEIRFLKCADGTTLAYAVAGSGHPLVKAANWLSHLEFDHQSPVWRHWWAALGARYQFVRYDERGCGLSDRDPPRFSFDAWVDDLEAVVDKVGLERFALLGISQGAAVAIAYAVRHPGRVSHLILYGGYCLGRARRARTPEQREETQVLRSLMHLGWGKGNSAFQRVFASLFMPDGTREQHQHFLELQQATASAENAEKFRDIFGVIDVTALAARVSVPTLVIHAREDLVVPVEQARLLASTIPNAEYVLIEGKNHILMEHEPGWQRFLTEVDRFVGRASKGSCIES